LLLPSLGVTVDGIVSIDVPSVLLVDTICGGTSMLLVASVPILTYLPFGRNAVYAQSYRLDY